METVLRAAAVYVVLLVIFRVAGRRTLAQMTTFDFVLLLIISEATQNALVGDDFSVTTATLAILTLVGLDIGSSLLKRDFPTFDKIIDGVPTILVENGRALSDRLYRARLSENDVLEAARSAQGLERLDQIKYAVLEVNGGITIIPKRD
jgi:uncharacterized membrane protein YcaP (DUF421 family)